jgi:hypothetical protein
MISDYKKSRYREYELRKQEIASTAQSVAEYQNRINKLAEELGA